MSKLPDLGVTSAEWRKIVLEEGAALWGEYRDDGKITGAEGIESLGRISGRIATRCNAEWVDVYEGQCISLTGLARLMGETDD